ncbi:hypothetical protein F1559_003833 [Cyanidiococcus yangmingshanensis]|uniref:Uncharacterized protein n=1 Tax=Cyanidiococcus yangmingshanensis TaxID=2690220 RepID=A0A7J7IE63_9RHOD|nr:hypothetical protein F1559_003833 [Cyanidiococcus yangmingshanensis]
MIPTFIPASLGNGNCIGTKERCCTNLKANEVLGWTTSVTLERRRRGARHRFCRTLNSVLACRVQGSSFFGIQAWPARGLDGRLLNWSGPVAGTKMAFSVVLPAFQWSADVVDGGSGFQATADVNGQASDSLEHRSNQPITREQTAENDAKRRLARNAPVPTIVLSGLEDALRLRLLGVLLHQVLRLPNPPDKQPQRVGVILSTYMAKQLGLVWNEQEEDWRVASNACADTLTTKSTIRFQDQCANRALLMPKLENLLKRRARNQVGTLPEDPTLAANPTVRADNAPSPVNIFDVQAAYGMDYIFICSPEKEEPHVVAETLARTESSLQLYALVSVVDAATARGIFTPTLRRSSTANTSVESEDSAHPSTPATSAVKDYKAITEVSSTGHESATETVQAAPAEPAPVMADTKSERPQEPGTDPIGDSETARRHHKMDRQRGSANRAQADNLVQLLVDQIEYANVVVVYDGEHSSGDCLSTALEQTSANESLAGAASIEKQCDEAPVHDVLRYLRLLNCEAQVISMNAGNEWPQVLLERILERPFEPERLLWMPTWRRVLASYAAAELVKTSPSTTGKETEAMRVTSSTPGSAADTDTGR